MHSSTANKHINRTFGQMQRPTPLLKWDKYIVKIEMINVFMGAHLIQFANKLKSKSEPAKELTRETKKTAHREIDRE